MNTLQSDKSFNNGQYRYVIPGNPIPLQRPRLNSYKVYDPQAIIKENLGFHLVSQFGQLKLNQPLHLDISFFLPLPINLSKKNKTTLSDTPHAKKPDIDNLVKFVLDIGNGIIWHDDSIIASLSATKHYSIDPHTEFIVKILN